MSDEAHDDDQVEDVVAQAEEIVEAEAMAELVEEDIGEFRRIAAERDEFREVAQRLQADIENFRKRAALQAEQTAEAKARQVVAELLPVLDTFELAESHLPTESELSAESKALLQTRAQLLDILSRLGLEVVPGAGEAFDPQVHEAVAHAEGESEDGPVVDEVLRAGYSWRGTVLRAAMVRVRG